MKSPLTYLLLAVIIFLVFLRSCPGEHKGRPATPAEIQKHVTKRDSVKAQVQIQERVRDTVIYRWRTKWDTAYKFIPAECDTFVKEVVKDCETVISADSTLIASLKAENTLADTIINKQAYNICRYQDSLKQKQRRSFWRGFKWGFGAGAVSGVVGSRVVR